MVSDLSSKTIVFESYLVKYQEAMNSGNKMLAQEIYNKIVDLYNPLHYISSWQHYEIFFDSYEDFKSEYINIFCKTLRTWSPRSKRKPESYITTGEFKNFFWGCLQNHFTNCVKAATAAKRNLSQSCPECGEWVTSLSTHAWEKHFDLVWEKMKQNGQDVTKIDDCPFCNKFKHRKQDVPLSEALQKHIMSKHSSLLYDCFIEKHPGAVLTQPRLCSPETKEDDSGNAINVYDYVADDNNIGSLLDSNLSDIQKKIVYKILNSRTKTEIKYTKDFECDKITFKKELQGLQDLAQRIGLTSN